MSKIYKVLAYPLEQPEHGFPSGILQVMGEYTDIENAFIRYVELRENKSWSQVQIVASVNVKLEVSND